MKLKYKIENPLFYIIPTDKGIKAGLFTPGWKRNVHNSFLSWLIEPIERIKHNFRFYGVISRNIEPNSATLQAWQILKQPVFKTKCSECNQVYWGKGNTFLCGRFNCYKSYKNKAAD